MLCDIGLPGRDGFQLLRLIRELPPESGGSMPVVAMTALGPRASQERTLEAGFQGTPVEAITSDRLLKVISSYCGTNSFRKEAGKPRSLE